jgi:hypothetical protein
VKIVISQHGDNPAKIDLRAKSDGQKFTALQRALLQAIDPPGYPQGLGVFSDEYDEVFSASAIHDPDETHEHWRFTLSLVDVKYPALIPLIRDLGFDVEIG